MIDDKEKLREEALAKWDETAWDEEYDNQEDIGYKGFRDGFDAGYEAAAHSWIAIAPTENAPDELPHGDYPIRRKSFGDMTVTGFYDGNWVDPADPLTDITDDVIAYYPVPPFTK